MKSFYKNCYLLVFITLLVVVASCGESADKTADRHNEPLSGAAVYRKYCVSCHGGIGQRIVSGRQLRQTSLEYEHIKAIIRHGVPPMPPFEKYLNEKEIENVSQYVFDLRTEKIK